MLAARAGLGREAVTRRCYRPMLRIVLPRGFSLSLWTRSVASILPAIRFGSCRVGDRAVRTPSAAPREVPVRDDLSPLLAAVVRDVDATVRNAALAPGSPSASLAS